MGDTPGPGLGGIRRGYAGEALRFQTSARGCYLESGWAEAEKTETSDVGCSGNGQTEPKRYLSYVANTTGCGRSPHLLSQATAFRPGNQFEAGQL